MSALVRKVFAAAEAFRSAFRSDLGNHHSPGRHMDCRRLLAACALVVLTGCASTDPGARWLANFGDPSVPPPPPGSFSFNVTDIIGDPAFLLDALRTGGDMPVVVSVLDPFDPPGVSLVQIFQQSAVGRVIFSAVNTSAPGTGDVTGCFSVDAGTNTPNLQFFVYGGESFTGSFRIDSTLNVNRLILVAGVLKGAPGTSPCLAAPPPADTPDTWRKLLGEPTPRALGALGAIDGKLYAANGMTGSDAGNNAIFTNSLEAYDPAASRWTTRTASPTARAYVGSAVVGNSLYVIGGFGGCTPICDTGLVEAYDSTTDTWSTLAPMPTPRFGTAVGVIDGKIYVAGGTGFPAPFPFAVLEVFDPATNTWNAKAPMPTPRYSATAAAVNGKLYVIGGAGSIASNSAVEIYDPATDTWTTGASMPTPRSEMASAVIDGLIHVVGGTAFGPVTANHEVYDSATDTWSTRAPMLTPRQSLTAAAIGSKLYAVGGFITQPTNAFEVYIAEPRDTLAPATTASTSPAPNAAGWNNSAVTVTLTAADNSGGSGVKSVTYAIGSAPATTVSGATTSFAVSAEGVTTITYYATDNAGNLEVLRSLTLRIDTTAPVLALPATITADATSPAGAIVSYTATATDNLDASPTVTCAPASGSAFPIGTTTVSCAAKDVAGNTSITSSTVTVNGPSAQGSNLIALVQSLNLGGGITNSLTIKLENANNSLGSGNVTSACNQLNAFVNQALAESGNNLTASQASQLIALANQIRAAAGCP